MTVGCLLVVALAAEVGALWTVLDKKKGDQIPPKSTWRGGPGPTTVVPPPGPQPAPGPDPNLDPHQNPVNPVGRGFPTGEVIGIAAVLLAWRLLGVNDQGDPKPRVLQVVAEDFAEPRPTPPPNPRP